MLFRGKDVAVVGGGNTAAEDALLLSRICKKVYLIHRRDSLRAADVYVQALKKADNVQFEWNGRVTDLQFGDRLSGVTITGSDGKMRRLNIEGLFVSIGRQPSSSLFKGQVDMDESGYIVADESTKTSVDGVFAAGDVRTKAVRQIVTAVADGAVAVHFAQYYLENN
jgi:thioredoxin reductase (NADPH)